jgi:chromosome segregation ATPase
MAKELIDIDELHPARLRRFMHHLSAAVMRAEDRSLKKQKIKEQVEKIKSVSLNKRTTKEVIETELGTFEDAVHEIIHDEEQILEEQRRETAQINELKKMVENLSRKLIEIGREYAAELEDKDRKIMELREALAAAHIRISETGDDRQKRIEDIERRIIEKHHAVADLEPVKLEKSASQQILEMESRLKMLEEKHKQLKKKGKVRKKDLALLKRLIDTHKKKISAVKAKKY